MLEKYATPVPLDRMLFTMVDPHRGFEVAHNRWYERDHFYARLHDRTAAGSRANAGSRPGA